MKGEIAVSPTIENEDLDRVTAFVSIYGDLFERLRRQIRGVGRV